MDLFVGLFVFFVFSLLVLWFWGFGFRVLACLVWVCCRVETSTLSPGEAPKPETPRPQLRSLAEGPAPSLNLKPETLV